MFDAMGRCIVVDEKHMDAVTALSASGPAFVYTIIESLVEGGVRVGLPRDIATLMASQMVHGAASMVSADRRTSGKAERYCDDPGRMHCRRFART